MWFLGLSTSRKSSYLVIGAITLVIVLTIIVRKCIVYSDSNHQDRDRKSSTKVSDHESKSDHHHKSKDSALTKNNDSSRITSRHHHQSAGIRTYSLQELEVATSDFKFRIGVGATSYVYLAELGDGRFGAVKRVMEERGGSQKMFLDEISVLLRISHPNLVGLMGFCLERGEQLVLLEYIPNKSLFDRLHKNPGGATSALTWTNRLSIALDIAYALDYLHSVADPPVIHRDIKSSNILLINDDHAKLADFGLCKLGNDVQQSQTPIAIKGSLGYIDMNYLNTGLVSPKSDVYSFGVLILELITGLRSLQGSFTLAEWTEEKRKSRDKEVLIEMVDPKIKNDVNGEQLKVLVDVANRALVEESDSRPCMMEIAYDIATCMEMVNNHSDHEQDSAELPV